MDNELLQAALMGWFTEYGELSDLLAEEQEDDSDPTIGDAVRGQLENCVEMAAAVIAVLGKYVLATASADPADPADPATVRASDGAEYVKPPF